MCPVLLLYEHIGNTADLWFQHLYYLLPCPTPNKREWQSTIRTVYLRFGRSDHLQIKVWLLDKSEKKKNALIICIERKNFHTRDMTTVAAIAINVTYWCRYWLVPFPSLLPSLPGLIVSPPLPFRFVHCIDHSGLL